jgi:hypothetical protein
LKTLDTVTDLAVRESVRLLQKGARVVCISRLCSPAV